MLGGNVTGESLIADRRIDECPNGGSNRRDTRYAGGAALLIGVVFRRVPLAFVISGRRLHPGAAIVLMDFRNDQGLAGDRGERD
jgi:hypothetical protein